MGDRSKIYYTTCGKMEEHKPGSVVLVDHIGTELGTESRAVCVVCGTASGYKC
jgi:hypothetical protein